jgi:hypothetical protein
MTGSMNRPLRRAATATSATCAYGGLAKPRIGRKDFGNSDPASPTEISSLSRGAGPGISLAGFCPEPLLCGLGRRR